jgi:tellurium resistance protein TerD
MSDLVLDLNKGMTLDLTKAGDTKFTIGLGWEAAPVNGQDVDLDVSAFMLQGNGAMKLLEMPHAIFFNNLNSTCGSVRLSGDSRDGKNGDIDEEIYVDVTKIPENINAIAMYINIFKPQITFSKVQKAKAVVSNQDGKVLARFDMSSQLTDENSLLVGVIKRNGRAWDFIAKGEGYLVQDLNTIVASLNKDGLEA